MYVHRNTIIYRLKKIEEILHLTLEFPDSSLQLSLAVYLYKQNYYKRPPRIVNRGGFLTVSILLANNHYRNWCISSHISCLATKKLFNLLVDLEPIINKSGLFKGISLLIINSPGFLH